MDTTLKRHPKDGDRIDLPLGWYMKLDGSTREGGDLQGFVFTPEDGTHRKESASLNFARECGTTSGDHEYDIPKRVHDALCLPIYDQFE